MRQVSFGGHSTIMGSQQKQLQEQSWIRVGFQFWLSPMQLGQGRSSSSSLAMQSNHSASKGNLPSNGASGTFTTRKHG